MRFWRIFFTIVIGAVHHTHSHCTYQNMIYVQVARILLYLTGIPHLVGHGRGFRSRPKG